MVGVRFLLSRRMLDGGGMGKSAVRGLGVVSFLAGEYMVGTACCMMAGVSGSMTPPSLVMGCLCFRCRGFSVGEEVHYCILDD